MYETREEYQHMYDEHMNQRKTMEEAMQKLEQEDREFKNTCVICGTAAGLLALLCILKKHFIGHRRKGRN